MVFEVSLSREWHQFAEAKRTPNVKVGSLDLPGHHRVARDRLSTFIPNDLRTPRDEMGPYAYDNYLGVV